MAICEMFSINVLILCWGILSSIRCFHGWCADGASYVGGHYYGRENCPTLLGEERFKYCVFIEFACSGGLMKSIIVVCIVQDLYFRVGVGCEWGFNIWWGAY